MLTDAEILATIQECEKFIDDALIAVSEGRLPDAAVDLVRGLKRSNALNRALIYERGERTKDTLSSIDRLIDNVMDAAKER